MSDDNVVDLGSERSQRRPEMSMNEILDDLHAQGMRPGGLTGTGQPGSWRTQDRRTERLSEGQFSKMETPSRPESSGGRISSIGALGWAGATTAIGIGLAARGLPPTNVLSNTVAPAVGLAGMTGIWYDQVKRPGSTLNALRGRGGKSKGE